MLVHVRPVALGIERPDRVELVEVVGDDIAKRERALAMETHQMGINLPRRGSCRQAEHCATAIRDRGVHSRLDPKGGGPAGRTRISVHQDRHPGTLYGSGGAEHEREAPGAVVVKARKSEAVKIAQRSDRRSEWSDRGGLQAFAWIDRAAAGIGRHRGLRGKLAAQQPKCDLDGVAWIVLAPLGIE